MTTLFALSASANPFNSFSYCQDAINNTFNVDRLLEKQKVIEDFEAGKPYLNEEAKIKRLNELYKDHEFIAEGHIGSQNDKGKSRRPLFVVNEEGRLVPNDKLITVSMFDESTGEYSFRVKGSDNSDAIALGKYVVKKDEQGRIMSIEQKGIDLRCPKCSIKMNLTYSKSKCVPKRILSYDANKQVAVVADAVVCKNLDNIRRDLYKKMKKLNKCMNALNEHYQTTSEVSEVMLERMSNPIPPNNNVSPGQLYSYLENINSLSKELKEKEEDFETRYSKQREFQEQYNELLNQCESYLGKDTVKARNVFKKESKIYEIKKERRSENQVSPLSGKVIQK